MALVDLHSAIEAIVNLPRSQISKVNRTDWMSGREMDSVLGRRNLDLELNLPYLLFSFAAVLGAYFFTLWFISAIQFLLSTFILSGKSLHSFGRPSKTWAVITGASDGLGKEYALQLAKAGYSTLLISRTASKLDAVAQEIKQKFNNPTRTLAMDFAANRTSDYDKLKTIIDELDVSILINNVGLSHDIPTPFTETPFPELTDIITVNCTATLKVTQLVAVGMVQRKRGLILTMGSFGGTIPTPLLATYSGSKAFLQQWSSAVGAELAEHNITVELVQSYLVTTAMSKIRKSSLLIPNPRQYVKAVLAKIGRTGGAQGWAFSSTPYWSHAVLQWVVGCFVGPHNRVLLRGNVSFHQGIRKRALRKREGRGGRKVG